MSYASGFRVTAFDLTSFYQRAAAIYGAGSGDMGYGQTGVNIASPASSGSTGSKSPIKAADLAPLLSMIETCVTHQGLTFSAGITTTTGSPIIASSTIDSILDQIAYCRLLAPNTTSTSNVSASTITQTWTGNLAALFQVDFETEDNARFFFNSGSTIDVTFSHPAGTTSPDNEWRYALGTNVGTVSIGAHGVSNTGASAPLIDNIGYYELTDQVRELCGYTNIAADAPYTNDTIGFGFAAVRNGFTGANGANGTGLYISITLSDTHNQGTLAAGTTISLGYTKPSDLVGIVTPSFTVQTPLASPTG